MKVEFDIYFAYGSNLCPDQMSVRCPDHAIVGTGLLKDYEFCFPRSSSMRGGGVAGIKKKKDSTVWGVAYKLSKDDILKLDEIEALGICYNKTKIIIETTNGPIEAFSYIAIDEEGTHIPTRFYLDIILKGLNSRINEIPKEYIDYVSQFNVISN